MRSTIVRVILVLFALAGLAWWLRLLAHAKVPPPEGRWSPLPPEIDTGS